ncbi:cytochrome P450 [Xylariomycetidae sp. FL2044]|nr:cytochrome P450 [Xylariomycetidae sp. FL2044]
MESITLTILYATVRGLTIISMLLPLTASVNLIIRLFSDFGLPPDLPWAGRGHDQSLRAKAKANLASVFGLQGLLDEGYTKYSKNDETYVLPYYINGPQVILPPSQLHWLLEQPDSVLSQLHVNRQFLQSDYTFLHANLVDSPVHPEVVRHQLTKGITKFSADVADEMKASIEENWGLDTEWHEVRVYETMLSVISRLSLRVFMGLPLVRNKEFVKVCGSFIRSVVISAAAISIFPDILKPIVGPVFTLYDYFLYLRCRYFIMPIIRDRLAHLRRSDKSQDTDSKPADDYIQWAIDHALAKPVINPMELDPRVISCRFSVLAFAAIQSSVITLTNTLFDLAASPTCTATLTALREEVERETMAAAAANPGSASVPCWEKPTLLRMRHFDSALRESLRLNGFVERGVMKMVVAPGGIALPDGSRIPCGTKVGISGYCLHRDEENYEDALTYKAFRFAGNEEKDGSGKRQALVATSDKFMGFSHGSHSCPGRFFAANQLKIALAHIVSLYDIEPIPARPVNKWFFGHIAPPLTETLRVRRREGTF